MKTIHDWLILLAFLFFLWLSISSAAFQWRNPTANRVQLLRELPSVLKFEKLEKFQ